MHKKILVLVAIMMCVSASIKAGPGIKISLMLYDAAIHYYESQQGMHDMKPATIKKISKPTQLKPTFLGSGIVSFKSTPSQAASKPILTGFKVLPESTSSGVGLAGALSASPTKAGIVHRPIHLGTMAEMLQKDIHERSGMFSTLDQEFKKEEQMLLNVLNHGSPQAKQQELHDLIKGLEKIKKVPVSDEMGVTISNFMRGAQDELARMGDHNAAR